MLEKIGSKDIIVRNYTDNFSVKEFIQEELIPQAFPYIPMNKLNLGFTGVISEYIGTLVEDSQATNALMLNEAFPTKAMLPESIYNHASLFDIGYQFAIPSTCNFAIEIKISNIIDYATAVVGTSVQRYKLDKNTTVIIGEHQYSLDYDIIIDHQYSNGRRLFNVYYDMDEINGISNVDNKYIKHQIANNEWLILFIEMREYLRRTDIFDVLDNFITTNTDINIMWSRQLAGIDLVYISPTGNRIPMKMIPKYSNKVSKTPFIFYQQENDNSMHLSFSANIANWTPEFNSKIEYVIYTTDGASSNFIQYDRKNAVPVKKVGTRFSYNTDTIINAFCTSGSVNGADRGDTETLRNEVILAYNTSNALVTERDMQLWFENYGKRNNCIGKFIKKRDDPCGRLFSTFIAIQDEDGIYKTNTLNIHIQENECDYVNTNDDSVEYIIKAGHLWEFTDDRDTVKMVHTADGILMLSDDELESIAETKQFLFTNPFLIKISKNPDISMSYNYMISNHSYPEEIRINTKTFYQFQLTNFTIDRSIINNSIHFEVMCTPVTTDEVTYINGIGDQFVKSDNNLRLVMVLNTKRDGETGYIELDPISIDDETQSIIFTTDINVIDNMNEYSEVEVDNSTPGIISLMQLNPGKILIDAKETHFHFLCMMKDPNVRTNSTLYGNESFNGYAISGKFHNRYKELNLYTPLSLMRNNLSFDNGIDISSVPLLKYDIPLNTSKMKYLIQTFDAQYKSLSNILSKYNDGISINDGNAIDFKFYNTYGKSKNYYIGPDPNYINLRDSQIRLDDIHITVNLIISVYDRTLYTQTVEEITSLLIDRLNGLGAEEVKDVHVSDIIQDVKDNIPNVRYVRFIGFNNYDANMQSIFVKYENLSDLTKNDLSNYVPELIQFDESSIVISEET